MVSFAATSYVKVIGSHWEGTRVCTHWHDVPFEKPQSTRGTTSSECAAPISCVSHQLVPCRQLNAFRYLKPHYVSDVVCTMSESWLLSVLLIHCHLNLSSSLCALSVLQKHPSGLPLFAELV